MTKQPELKYPLDARPGTVETVAVGLQHTMAMFVGIITPPLIVAPHLGFDTLETTFFVSMAFLASGLTTFIQVRRFGPLGTGLLSVQGTSFTFVSPSLIAAQVGGAPLVIGMSIATAFVETTLSFILKFARRFFPPIVSGTVVMLIGLSLIRVGITDLAGGFGASDFGSLENLSLGIFVLVVVTVLARVRHPLVSSLCVILGLLAGYLVAALLGRVDLSIIGEAGWVTVPQPLRFGLSFDWALALPFAMAYLVTTFESVGDITATSIASNQPVEGPIYERRISGGVLADSVGSVLAGFLNSMPNTTFSQNNGLILLTGVAARKVGYAVAGILCLLGMFPKLAALLSIMPRPVLGGATVVLFGMIVVGGIRVVNQAGLTARNSIIFVVSLALGLGVEFVPTVLQDLPEAARNVLSSGLATGALAGILLNLALPEDRAG